MTLGRLRHTLAVAWLVLPVLAGCAPSGAPTTAAAPPAGSPPVRVAVVGPMSGTYRAFGEQMRQAAQLAADDINGRGGLQGHRMTVDVVDDGCDARQAPSVARRLADQDIKFVVGHFCSSASIAAADTYAARGILEITPASTNPMLTDGRTAPMLFRTVPRDDGQGAVAADWAAAHYRAGKIAIVQDGSPYGRTVANGFRQQLHNDGITEVAYLTIKPGESAYSAVTSQLIERQVDLVYFGGYHAEAAVLLHELRRGGSSAQMLAADALVTDEFGKAAGGDGEGVRMTFLRDSRGNPDAATVVQALRRRYPDFHEYSLRSYAAMQALAAAADQAGSVEPAAVAKALHGMRVQTVVGPLEWNARGDLFDQDFMFYVWHAGVYGAAP